MMSVRQSLRLKIASAVSFSLRFTRPLGVWLILCLCYSTLQFIVEAAGPLLVSSAPPPRRLRLVSVPPSRMPDDCTNLSLTDEFDGPTLDTSVWDVSRGMPAVSGGKLILNGAEVQSKLNFRCGALHG